MSQLTLFDLEPTEKAEEEVIVEAVPKKQIKAVKLEAKILPPIEKVASDFISILELLGYDGFSYARYSCCNVNHYAIADACGSRKLISSAHAQNSLKIFPKYDKKFSLVEFAETGEAFCLDIVFDNRTSYCNNPAITQKKKIRQIKGIPADKTTLFVQSKGDILEILKNANPYGYKFLEHNGYNLYDLAPVLLLAPQLEQLKKAGFAFADKILDKRVFELGCKETGSFGRLTQPGTNLKSIFKTSKAVYTALKDEIDLSIWESFRKMDKFGRIRADEVVDFYNAEYGVKEIEQIGSILSARYDGKQLFTLHSLNTYLQRLDMFEAIPAGEAIPLLQDYLRMCKQLEVKPRIDGDSLKREHDIMARNCRNRRNEIMAKKMIPACENLKKFDYEEDVFLIRGIRDMDDLIDEANQQHNCVASYASRIASGSSKIYVMRLKAAPDRALITVELTADGKEIRQKYMAYNRPIRNKAQTDFLNRWLAFCRAGGNIQVSAA